MLIMKKADKILQNESNYTILQEIGKGSYATVHKAINNETKEFFAIKKIAIQNSEYDHFYNEINILDDCNCKNIVEFFDSACFGEEVKIAMEYCCGGSVKDVIRRPNVTLNQEQILVIARDVLNGLDYLHKKSKIHRDVKAANILLNEHGIAKLCDLGVSEPLNKTTKKQPKVGTLLWLAPELVNGDNLYNELIDIWSLGITIIEMADKQPPCSQECEQAAMKKIGDLTNPSPTFRNPAKWSQSLRDFLSLCLDKDKTTRKSANELLNQEIIINAPSNDLIKSLLNEIALMDNIERMSENHHRFYDESGRILDRVSTLLVSSRERLRKVVRVDHVTDGLNSYRRNFEKLLDKTKLENEEVDELTLEWKALMSEISKLEDEKKKVEAEYENIESRNSKITNDLVKIKRILDNDEMVRKRKLSSLKS